MKWCRNFGEQPVVTSNDLLGREKQLFASESYCHLPPSLEGYAVTSIAPPFPADEDCPVDSTAD